MNGNNVHLLPDNYFYAGNATQMAASLTSAFQNIAIAVTPYATSFSLSNPYVASAGELTVSSQYASANWTGVVTGSILAFNGGAPVQQQSWTSSSTLQSQLAGTGWRTARKVVTWNGSAGTPFELANMTAAQLAALVPSSYSASTTSTQYMNYLRGDTTNQVGSTAAGSTQSLRARALFLGDIVDANLTAVASPTMSYTEANNPGYAAFKTLWTTTSPRPTMVYAGSNDGMLHGFLGKTGYEQFAYIPSALFQGPTGTPLINGLAALGNPNFNHHFYVDATPVAADVDLNRTNGNTGGTPNWRTLLIGGLGKGGTSYYAIDVTNPSAMTSESAVASDVLWEFSDPTMGYSSGTPVVVKTAQYGWVVIFTSGYDNADGYGYLYLVNAATGTLLQKIRTSSPSSGLARASAYVQDYTDYTTNSVYAGDLNGQVWRFDLTEITGNYPAPSLLAIVTDPSGVAQPVTSPPLIEIHPVTRQRYVMFGTGQLLSSADVGSTQVQSFYALVDGTSGGFSTITVPASRATLQPIADNTANVSVAASFNGWNYDLPSGYRVLSAPTAYNGVVAFSTSAVSTDPCSPQGTSDVYAVNYASGRSVINSTSSDTSGQNTGGSATTLVPAVAFTSAVNNLKIVSNNGTPELIAGTTTGALSQINADLSSIFGTRLLNWREVPTAE
jgi:type IV pilus assembly protein PilY1